MSRPKLQHCVNGCCYFIDGKLVTKAEYEAALQQHKAFETISICYQLKPRAKIRSTCTLTAHTDKTNCEFFCLRLKLQDMG